MQYKRLQPQPPKKNGHWGVKFVVGLVLVIFGLGLLWMSHRGQAKSMVKSSGTTNNLSLQPVAGTPAPPPDACAAQASTKVILVSISKQHVWACESGKSVYNAAVITGMELYPADLTPTGTYQILNDKEAPPPHPLAGCDSTGCWSDPVSYWMPFLSNKYGLYGFHDATWRTASEFGNVNINAAYTAPVHGSHGCVEMPLAAMKWLYNWAPVNTTVTIES